jgi:TolB-like protein
MRSILGSVAITLILAITGCAGDPHAPANSTVTAGSSAYTRGDLATLTYRAVDLLLAATPETPEGTPLVVASIANVKDVDTSSPLGNIVSEMVRTRLVQDGHVTTEMRLRSAVSFNSKQGEFLLSRNRRALVPPPQAAAVVTGTYAVGYDKVYVSLKLISATDARIISGADFVVPALDVVGLLPEVRTP